MNTEAERVAERERIGRIETSSCSWEGRSCLRVQLLNQWQKILCPIIKLNCPFYGGGLFNVSLMRLAIDPLVNLDSFVSHYLPWLTIEYTWKLLDKGKATCTLTERGFCAMIILYINIILLKLYGALSKYFCKIEIDIEITNLKEVEILCEQRILKMQRPQCL